MTTSSADEFTPFVHRSDAKNVVKISIEPENKKSHQINLPQDQKML
eukprot:UN08320